MDYKLQYEKLIQRGKNRELNGYSEKHHIIPKCMNGSDDSENLVSLTAREHFIAHLLLIKIYPKEYRLINAIQMMTVSSKDHNCNRIHNRMYGWLKEKFSKRMSKLNQGHNNSQFGTMWISNIELKQSKKINKTDDIPEGWVKGRNVWKRLERKLERSKKSEQRKPEREKAEQHKKDRLKKRILLI